MEQFEFNIACNRTDIEVEVYEWIADAMDRYLKMKPTVDGKAAYLALQMLSVGAEVKKVERLFGVWGLMQTYRAVGGRVVPIEVSG